MEVFPLLVPEDSSLQSYHGYITVQDHEYQFRLQLGPNRSLKEGSSILCSHELKSLLQEHEHTLRQRFLQSKDVESFLLELKDILERVLRSAGKSAVEATAPLLHPNQLNLYTNVVAELQDIGWDRVISVDDSLTKIQLLLKDSSQREHSLLLQIPLDYPSSPPLGAIDLPIALDISWNKHTGSIRKIMEQYEQALEKYQDFWAVMEHLDQHTWVLEPEHPNRAATMRRIALGNHCSLQINLDPFRPRALPECRFWGADSIIAPLRSNLNKTMHLWDHSGNLLTNLESVLGLTLPSPLTTRKEEFLGECGICYSYRVGEGEGRIPDRACDFPKCGRPFHNTCLHDWLRSLSTSRQSVNTVFGTCPYCQSPISATQTR